MAYLLGVKLLNPIYKKSRCYKNVSFGWCIFLNPEHMRCLYLPPQKILPLNMLYVETVSSIMFDVSCLTVPTNISNLFTKANEKHNHETRFSSSCNFYINRSRLNQNHGSFAKFGAKLWNSICDKFRQLPKGAFKKHINDILFSLLEAEDDYVESPILLQLICKV